MSGAVLVQGLQGVPDYTAAAFAEKKISLRDHDFIDGLWTEDSPPVPATEAWLVDDAAAGLTAALDQSTLPDGWHVAQRGRTLVLCGNNGTMVVFR